MKGKKPQKELIRFMIKPQYYQFLGLVVNKDTDIDDVTNDGKVHQTIKNNVFTTTITDEKEIDGMKIKEKSKISIELKEGTRLIWIDGKGYVLPEYQVISVAEAKNDLEAIEDIQGTDYKDENYRFDKNDLGE